MNVLSLFDGMSCGQLALKKAGINVDNYYASEIDKYAIKVTQSNFPKTIQLGDINDWKNWDISKIDLILAGSPCQGFSFAGRQLNFNDPRSALFFKFIEILKFHNPKYFLLENVKMKKEYEQVITDTLNVKPILLNSSLVSAQNRERLYWFNWDAKLPKDKRLKISDVYQANTGKALTEKTASRPRTLRNLRQHNQKAFCMLATMYKLAQANGMTVIQDGKYLRCVTPLECERLQTVPDDYTNHVSDTQRYKMLGNGWTVEMVAHILKEIKLNSGNPDQTGRWNKYHKVFVDNVGLKSEIERMRTENANMLHDAIKRDERIEALEKENEELREINKNLIAAVRKADEVVMFYERDFYEAGYGYKTREYLDTDERQAIKQLI